MHDHRAGVASGVRRLKPAKSSSQQSKWRSKFRPHVSHIKGDGSR